MESWRTPGQVVILIALFALMGTGSFASEEKTGEFKLLRDENTETVEGCTIEKFRILSPAMNREIKALVVLPPK